MLTTKDASHGLQAGGRAIPLHLLWRATAQSLQP